MDCLQLKTVQNFANSVTNPGTEKQPVTCQALEDTIVYEDAINKQTHD